MDYEKKYKEALDRAKKFKENPKAIFFGEKNVHVSDYIFPELQESEDERIRKALIDLIYKIYANTSYITCDEHERMLAWLEKQGEKLPVGFYYVNSEGKKFYSDTFKYGNVTLHVEKQGNKPQGKSVLEATNEAKIDNANKVEPKFDVDDWIICNETLVKIVDCDNNRYTVETTEDLRWAALIDTVDREFHLWTIEDAKEGDVLCDYNNIYDHPLIFILKKFECVDFGLVRPSDYSSYCFITTGYRLIFKEGMYHHKTNIKPATKEQRDLLFKKMHEAGYEWDDKKLELKKIANDNAE